MQAKPLNLRIVTREEVLYEGQISSLTSVNEKGRFDVLRKHANFISLIKDYIVLQDIERKERRFDIGNGIMKVLENNVSVYLGVKQ